MTTQRVYNPAERFPDHLTADAWDYDHEAYLETHRQQMAARKAEEERERQLSRNRLTIAAGALMGKTKTMARDARTCLTIIEAFAGDEEYPQQARDSVLEAAEKLRQAEALVNEATTLLKPAKEISRQIFETERGR